jgi:hypothetical protein
MKGRKGKANGGEMDSPKEGTKEYEQDLKSKNMRYTYQSKVNDEAEERKSGGRAKKKHVGKVHGMHAMHHAGRKPRRSGGRTSSDASPLSSAHAGTPPKGHKALDID